MPAEEFNVISTPPPAVVDTMTPRPQRGVEPLWTLEFILLTLANGMFFSTLFSLMPVLPLYVTSLGGNETQVGIVTSASATTAIFIRFVAGPAIDRWGARPFLIGGGIASSVSALMLLWADSVGTVVFSRLVHGASMGVFSTAASVLAAQIVPVPRRAEGLGWFGLSGNVAMALGPVASSAVAVTFGFEGVFWATLGLSVAAIMIALVVRKRPPETEDASATVPKVSRPKRGWLRLSQGAMIPSATMLFVAVGLGGVMTFAPILGVQIGLESAGVFYTTMAVSQMTARVLTGRLADRFGRKKVIFPSLIWAMIGLAAFGFVKGAGGLILVAFLFGLGWGALMPAMLALAIDLSESDERGAAMATYFGAVDGGVALGTPLIGMIIGEASFGTAFLLAAAAAGLGTVIFVRNRRLIT